MVKTTQQGIAARIEAAITAHNNNPENADNKRNILWLSQKSGVSRSTLIRRMASEEEFTVRELAKISAALDLHPSELASLYFAELATA